MPVGCRGAAAIPWPEQGGLVSVVGFGFWGFGFEVGFFLIFYAIRGVSWSLDQKGEFCHLLGLVLCPSRYDSCVEAGVKDPVHHFAQTQQVINCWSRLICWM